MTIGVTFVLGAAAAGVGSPLVGRLADRRGWRTPVLAGLCAATVGVALLCLPRSAALLVVLVVLADSLFCVSYPPAGALISDGADEAGLGQVYAFSLFNLAWAGGQVIGGAGSASLAQLSSDTVPYLLLAGLCLATAIAVWRVGRRVVSAVG